LRHTGVLTGLSQAVEIERRVAHAAVVATIRGREFTEFQSSISMWTTAGVETPSVLGDSRMSKRLSTLAPYLLARVANDVRRRGRHAARRSAAQLHRLRKSLDSLCDDVQFLADIYPQRAACSYRDRCERVQEILGASNDAVVTRGLALALVAHGRPELETAARALIIWT